jgi:hypothetical protein
MDKVIADFFSSSSASVISTVVRQRLVSPSTHCGKTAEILGIPQSMLCRRLRNHSLELRHQDSARRVVIKKAAPKNSGVLECEVDTLEHANQPA